MRKYIFEIEVNSEEDNEYWDSNPTIEQVQNDIMFTLEACGWNVSMFKLMEHRYINYKRKEG